MKAIKFNGYITSISSKKDGSLGLRISTPELKSTEKVAAMELQGVSTDIYIQPLDHKITDVVIVDKDAGMKTPSERLRAVIYIWWEQLGRKGDSNSFYFAYMETLIDHVKSKWEG